MLIRRGETCPICGVVSIRVGTTHRCDPKTLNRIEVARKAAENRQPRSPTEGQRLDDGVWLLSLSENDEDAAG